MLNGERFTVFEKLGQGKYASVYRCQDNYTNNILAVKFFDELQFENNSQIKDQARALMRVNHQNVVKVISIERIMNPISKQMSNGILMDYIDGVNLSEYLRKSIDLDTCQSLGNQLIDGVKAIHSAKVLHRDLHEANVLVTTEGTLFIIDIFYMLTLANLDSEGIDYYFSADIKSMVRLLGFIMKSCPNIRFNEYSFRDEAQQMSINDVRDYFNRIITRNRNLRKKRSFVCTATTMIGQDPITYVLEEKDGNLNVSEIPGVVICSSNDIYVLTDRNESIGLISGSDAISGEENPAISHYENICIPYFESVIGQNTAEVHSIDQNDLISDYTADYWYGFEIYSFSDNIVCFSNKIYTYTGGAHGGTDCYFGKLNLDSGTISWENNFSEYFDVVERNFKECVDVLSEKGADFYDILDRNSLEYNELSRRDFSITAQTKYINKGEAKVEYLVTTFAPYAASDDLWGSYTVSCWIEDNVIDFSAPELVLQFAKENNLRIFGWSTCKDNDLVEELMQLTSQSSVRQ